MIIVKCPMSNDLLSRKEPWSRDSMVFYKYGSDGSGRGALKGQGFLESSELSFDSLSCSESGALRL